MLQKLFLAIVALLLGLALGALTLGNPRAPGALAGADGDSDAAEQRPSGSDYARIIDGLSATLELEVAERQRLEEQVQTMAMQIGRLQRQLGDASERGAEDEDEAERLAKRRAAGAEEAQERTALTPFIEAGFDPARAEYVKQIQDDLALQRLYLRDQAEREGWLRTPRYRDAMQALAAREQGLRQDLGEEDYDRYLYALGRPNRVVVGDVLENGPAQQAGIEVGDAILSYGGERIYDAGALVGATRDGTSGVSTSVEIERAGETQLVYVPRGPLGINLRVARVRPEG